MEGTVKFWKIFITCIFVTTLFNNCRGCTPFTPINLGSIGSPLEEYIKEAAKDVMPVFNKSTVPNLNTLIEQFNAASNHEDIHLNITQLLNKYGYPSETHEVKTSDGYLLDIFRIPGNGTPVVIFHGITSSSDDFVTSGPDRALAYNLADQGYDVWLGNMRGNKHGRRHVTLSPDCAEFWDFSFDELGRYDVPATIDYILEATGHEKLAYVGHSQGCTAFIVMTSELTEYNSKISIMVALSSVVYLKHSRSPVFNVLAPIADPFYLASKSIGLYEFLPRNIFTDIFTSTACDTPATAALFCGNLVFLVFGFDYPQVNATILPTFFGHYPAGTATKQFVNYLQMIISGEFQRFDYGIAGNLKNYNSATPPKYVIERIASKMVIFHSDNDYFSVDVDRKKLEARLGDNVIETYRVPLASFTHGDFLYANNLKTLVNDKVIEILKKYA